MVGSKTESPVAPEGAGVRVELDKGTELGAACRLGGHPWSIGAVAVERRAHWGVRAIVSSEFRPA